MGVKSGDLHEAACQLSELRAWQRFHIRLTALYAVFVFTAVAVICFAFYRYGVETELRALRSRLATITTALAAGIDADRVAALAPDQQDSPLQRELCERFARVCEKDGDVNTIYVLRTTAEPGMLQVVIEYLEDDEPMDPGQLYDARHLPVMLRGLREPAVEEKLFEDEYGFSLSGYAPLITSGGESVGLIGTDVMATRITAIRKHVIKYAVALYAVATLLLGVAALVVGRSVQKPLTRIIEVTEAVAKGHFETRARLERSDEFGLMGRHFDHMAEGLEEREFIRETFGRYVSEEVATNLLKDQEAPKLGGEERIVTVLFSDIRGYSTISELLTPTQVVDMLNAYLGAMNVVIDAHKGCVIEFLGDAILAVFNAPNRLENHQEQAVRCALEMRRRLGDLNAEWETSGLARLWKDRGIESLAARIGLHTGRVVAGNLGGHTRMKYAVIGDSVNLAARLEQLNKELGTEILMSAALRDELPPDLANPAESQGRHKVKGRGEEVEVFAL